MLYLLTIRKSQVKDYIQQNDLDDILTFILNTTKGYLLGKGYHIHGKYKQLHMHALTQIPFTTNTWLNGYRIYYSKVHSNIHKVISYIHSDHKNIYELSQLLIQNYYNHHYGFIPDV